MDIRLITLIPPPTIGQPPSVQSATTNAANILAQLSHGSLLSGFIINRDASGNPILRTEKGDVLFSSQFFLKIGSEVVIRIANSGGQQNAHIVTVNGLPPEVAESQSGFSETPDVLGGRTPAQNNPAASASRASQMPLPATGSNIPALIVTPPPAQSSATPPLPPGTSLLLTVLGYGQPQQSGGNRAAIAQLIPDAQQIQTAQPANALSSLLPDTASTATSAITTAATQTASTPSTLLTAASLPITLSNQAATGAQLSGPLGQTMVATTIAHYEGEITTLASPLGMLRTAHLGGLPAGEQIYVRVSSMVNTNGYTLGLANATPSAPPAAITELAHTWTSLTQIAQLLAESGSPLAMAGLPTIPILAAGAMPSPATIGTHMLFFIAALKGGDFKGWLGERNVRALEEKGYGSLIRKAEGEFMLMAKQFIDAPPHQWQSLFIPVMVAGELQQVRAFIKREKKKNKQGKLTGDEDTRFVVEMSLSQLGEMQMDGLVKRRESSLQFDLAIRSLEPLPKFIEREIQEIYTSTSELMGYTGQIAFSTMHQFPIHPINDIAPHVDDVIA